MEKREPIGSELVKKFIYDAHGNLQSVKTMLEQEPMLANAAWDWGGGDWETGLGGAAHMGRKDIAEFLLSQGARMDIFAAAMLGQLDIVKAILRAFPEMRHQRGPHGIPLLNHAKAGGEAATGVLTFLEGLEEA